MRGHIRRRGKTWAIVLDVGRDPETNKRKQKWFGGYKTKGGAEDALVDLLGKRKLGLTVDPDLTPVAVYLREWLEGRTDLAPLSVTQYGSVIRNHISGTPLGATPLGKVRRAHIRAHAAELERKGLSRATRHTVRAVLSRAFGDAVEDDLVSLDPTIRKTKRKASESPETPKFTVWTRKELLALLEAVSDDRLKALWRVAIATGARRGELLGLTWLGFSAEEAKLAISQQVTPTRGGVTISECKTRGSHRTISLDPETVRALEGHRDRQVAERELAGEAYTDHDLIFPDELGQPINPQRLTERFAALRKATGIRPGRLHDIRHSHASHLLQKPVSSPRRCRSAWAQLADGDALRLRPRPAEGRRASGLGYSRDAHLVAVVCVAFATTKQNRSARRRT